MRAYAVDTGLPGLSDLIHSEYDPTFTTDKKVLLAGSGAQRVVPFAGLVAAVTRGASAAVAGAVVGTGNGAIGTPTVDADALEGLYQVVIIEPASNGGTYEVIRPDGVLDGTGTIGVAFNGMINFTLADGATDFVAGDRIPVTVSFAATPGKFIQWDPTLKNGGQTIKGLNISLPDATAEDGVDGEIIVLARGPCIVRKEAIVFHDGATTDQKTAAYAALEALGIQCRTSG